MTISVGDRLPEASFMTMTADGPNKLSTADVFAGKTVALFAVPGAFTPTCSASHLPGYVQHADALREKGVDDIICISVNDAFVMTAWGIDQNVEGRVRMVAEGSALFAKTTGLELDLTERGLGMRSQRFSMIVENGVVKDIATEDPPTAEATGAEAMLDKIAAA